MSGNFGRLARNFGRLVPEDWDHVQKYPFSALAPKKAIVAERTLRLTWWHWSHNQGAEGSCVGHGIVFERAITNIAEAYFLGLVRRGRRYNPIDVWNEAKKIDEWSDTNPGDENGTSVRAGYDVCRTIGLKRVTSMRLVDGYPQPYGERERSLSEGILRNRWATSVDEIRVAISEGLPVTIGVNWYSNFDLQTVKPGLFGKDEYWIGESSNLGAIRGGHCVTLYGVSDKRQAFKLKNSWGLDYPLVWLTYSAMERLLQEEGEAALVTDRLEG